MHAFKQRYTLNVPALGTDVEATYIAFVAPFDGQIESHSFVPVAAMTGAASNHRKLALVNKGQGGAGTTEMSALAFDNGVNGVAFDEKTIPLSAVDGAIEFVAGDVVVLASTTPGTGIADPGGQHVIKVSRSQA